jgi:hypothetical protein
MPILTVRISILALLLASLVVIGCGSSSDPEVPAISKAEFTKRAESICARSGKQQRLEFEQAIKHRNPTGSYTPVGPLVWEELTKDVTIPNLRSMVGELEQLDQPTSIQTQIATLISQLQLGLRRTEASPHTFATGEAFGKAAATAEALGLDECKV